MITINHKKKRFNFNLLSGIVWALFFIVKLIFSEDNSLNLLEYGWLILSLLYFFIYYFERFKPYITIDNDVICRYAPFPKRINIPDIIKVKHFAGEYSIETTSTSMKIQLSSISESDLSKLKSVIEQLQIKTNLV
ncbi:hypothetical protein [Formosa haliotis]|uniref:hypothetical protein n=1 Tax=Formosa haliotis TaxID=1555194 RepID=UPI000824889D|nr:hypothetical protein [Formosa haliotis]